MDTFKRFFLPVMENPIMAIQSIVYALWVSLFGLVSVWTFQQITKTIENQSSDDFFMILAVYIGIIIIYFIGLYIMKYWHWVNRYRTDIRSMHRVFMTKFFALDNTQVEKYGTGMRISLIESWFHTRTDLIVFGIHTGVRVSVIFLYVLYVFWSTNGWYALGFLWLFVLLHLLTAWINQYVITHRKERIDNQNSYNSQLVKMIMSKFEIAHSGKQQREIGILDSYADASTDCNRWEQKYLFFIVNTPIVLIHVLKILWCLTIGYAVIQWQWTIADFIGILLLLWLLENALTESIEYFKEFFFNFATVQKLRDHFDGIKENAWMIWWKEFLFTQWSIVFEKVSFGYDDGKKIFTDFDARLAWWSITALVWPSGWGKTTLMKLIAGYMMPDSGDIIVDGQKLSSVSLQTYYHHIGYLTQEPSVFDGTVRENLLYGVGDQKPTPTPPITGGTFNSQSFSKETEKEKNSANILPVVGRGDPLGGGVLHDILQKSQCQFVYDLPNGLDTEIGERGVRLSWWQRQRLAIAKIMLKNPKIILLDEPTSALDSVSEELVGQAMQELFKDRTVVIIAHRLQTVKHADRILYITPNPLTGASEIAEEGTHQELIALWWKYAKMVEVQTGF